MKIVITPAKRMYNEVEYFEAENKPIFLKETQIILEHLKKLSLNEVKKLLKCSDKIAQEAYQMYHTMNLFNNTVPALFAYKGIQYDNLAPHVLTNEDYQFIREHLRILSGFYGVLKPFDGIVAYRLELNDQLEVENCPNLYAFWHDKIYNEIIRDDNIILDLGAKQYSRIIKKYLSDNVKYVKCYFMEKYNDCYKEIGVYVKIARGQMVRYLVENRIDCLEDVKKFNSLGYKFCQQKSDYQNYVFIRDKIA